MDPLPAKRKGNGYEIFNKIQVVSEENLVNYYIKMILCIPPVNMPGISHGSPNVEPKRMESKWERRTCQIKKAKKTNFHQDQ